MTGETEERQTIYEQYPEPVRNIGEGIRPNHREGMTAPPVRCHQSPPDG
jgi:hypothetical protein